MSVAAFFDIDGTITHTTIVHPLIWYRRAHLSRLQFTLLAIGLLLCTPYYLWVDRRSRSRFNVVFYRRYAGLPAQDLRDWHRQTFADNLQRTISVEALACIRNHQGRGHRIVLVTGGLDLVMRPLAEYLRADELIATHLAEVGGRFTGALDGPPIADAYKATLIRGYAQRHGIVLEQSYAYGNSIGDAPMLACVSNAVAVNADRRLRRLADAGGWRKEQWRSA